MLCFLIGGFPHFVFFYLLFFFGEGMDCSGVFLRLGHVRLDAARARRGLVTTSTDVKREIVPGNEGDAPTTANVRVTL